MLSAKEISDLEIELNTRTNKLNLIVSADIELKLCLPTKDNRHIWQSILERTDVVIYADYRYYKFLMVTKKDKIDYVYGFNGLILDKYLFYVLDNTKPISKCNCCLYSKEVDLTKEVNEGADLMFSQLNKMSF